MEKKITIIVPVYNVEKYIEQCIGSIIRQTYKNLEIIIINDGSTDNSLEKIKPFLEDTRIKTISQVNKGIGAVRNKGLELATGDYISFVDSDDWIREDYCEKCIKNIENNDIIIFNSNFYDEENRKIIPNIIKETIIENFEQNKKGYLLYGYPYALWNKMYKRSYLEKNKFKFLEIINEDVFWGMETLFLTDNIRFLNENLYYYRANRLGSITEEQKSIEFSKNKNEILQKQKISYETIYKNMEIFLEKNKNKFTKEQLLIGAVEVEVWRGKREAEANLKNINLYIKDYFENKDINKLHKKEIIKKIKNLIDNKNIIKIDELNFFNIYYWKLGILSWKGIRRQVVKKIKKLTNKEI